MIDLNPGDSIVRAMDGLKQGEYWRNDGHVTAVSDTQIVCTVFVDVPRSMTFDRVTGVNVYGKEYGWLESK